MRDGRADQVPISRSYESRSYADTYEFTANVRMLAHVYACVGVTRDSGESSRRIDRWIDVTAKREIFSVRGTWSSRRKRERKSVDKLSGCSF